LKYNLTCGNHCLTGYWLVDILLGGQNNLRIRAWAMGEAEESRRNSVIIYHNSSKKQCLLHVWLNIILDDSLFIIHYIRKHYRFLLLTDRIEINKVHTSESSTGLCISFCSVDWTPIVRCHLELLVRFEWNLDKDLESDLQDLGKHYHQTLYCNVQYYCAKNTNTIIVNIFYKLIKIIFL